MMNKKFLKTILFGGLFLSLTGAFVSCAEDYSDDIQNLQTQITTNSNAIAELQALLAKGVVITSVEKNAEGILLTLSDGSTQQLTNGADGKDGQNGADGKDGQNGADGKDGVDGVDGKDADVWTIDKDGFWCLNGKPTEYKAVGQDGTSTNGVDGGYYRPNAETGFFDYVAADGTVTPSTISWKSSSLTAVQTETGVLFSGIAGAEDGLFISTVAELKSLVFKPQLVVDGVNAIKAGVLMLGDETSTTVLCAPAVYAEYHMNPSTVNANGIDKESLEYVALTKDYKKTRAISNVTASYNTVADGMLKVNVAFNGLPSVGEKIDLIALQVKNAADEVITSDYATVDADPIYTDNLAIARKSIIADAEAHYWTLDDDAKAAAIAEAAAATDKKASTDARIIAVDYNKSINLYDYVSVCDFNRTTHSEFNMEAYHMHLEFSKLDAFIVNDGGDNTHNNGGLKEKTDQQQFITLENYDNEDGSRVAKVTPKTYEDGENLRSSIGRTPIIKAQLVHEDNGVRKVIETRWIALEIVDTVPGPVIDDDEPVYPVGSVHNVTTIDAFLEHSAKFDCYEERTVMITAEQMNTVYSKIGAKGISKEDFAANFEFFNGKASFRLDENNNLVYDAKDVKAESAETSKEVSYSANVGQITSYGLTWKLNTQYLWDHAGETPTATAIYKHKTEDYYVVINLTAGAAIPERPVLPTYTAEGERIAEMWYNDKEDNNVLKGMFNVRVPNVGESNSANCTFVNELLSLFIDDNDPIKSVKDEILAKHGVEAKYVIKKAYIIKNKKKIYDNFNVKFENDVYNLYYNTELICTLDGTEVTLNHNSEKAKELLNTNAFYVTYGVEAMFETCLLGEKDLIENSTFDVRYVRPLNVNPEAVGQFQDGNDFGDEGTLIEAAKIISLEDWRGNYVVEGGTYYGYYGVKTVTVDNSGVTCNMAAGENIKLPSHIKAGIVNDEARKDADLNGLLAQKELDENGEPTDTYIYKDNEWFYYKNNGTVLQEDIEINFPVIVEYYWGKVVTQKVTVKVLKTNNINKAAQK